MLVTKDFELEVFNVDVLDEQTTDKAVSEIKVVSVVSTPAKPRREHLPFSLEGFNHCWRTDRVEMPLGALPKPGTHAVLPGKRITIRIDAADRAVLEANAELYGLSLGAYVKAKARGVHLQQPLLTAAERNRLALQISHLQGDSRQLAHAINSLQYARGPIDAATQEQLIAGFEEMREGYLQLKHFLMTNGDTKPVSKD